MGMIKRNPERMRYKNDTKSAGLCYLSILCCIAYFISLYANNAILPDIRMGIDVILNILFMLIVFWASEMVKVYDRKWSVLLAFSGAAQTGRMSWLPARYKELGQLSGANYIFVCAFLVFSGVLLIVAATLSYSNSTTLKKHLNNQ